MARGIKGLTPVGKAGDYQRKLDAARRAEAIERLRQKKFKQ